MMNPHMEYRLENEELMQEWEVKLIEWCFQYPEQQICNVYFNALMNEKFRRRVHGSV